MRFHSRELLYFDAVRRAGSIREAARSLNVASSAVNRKILQIEEEIGMPLFERHAAGVSLTAAGEALARHAIHVLQDLERTESELEGLRGGTRGSVSVAAVEAVCLSPLPEVIRALHRRAPRIEVEVQSLGSKAIPAALADGRADVGIAFDLASGDGLKQVFAARAALGAVMSPEHPLAERETVTLSDCAEWPMVRAGSNLSMARRIEDLMARSGLNRPAAVTTDSIVLMQQLAMRPPYVAFQAAFGLETLARDGALVFVPLRAGGDLSIGFGVYMREGRALPTAVDLFLQQLTQTLTAMPALRG